MILEKAIEEFNKHIPKFLIFGIKSNGKKCLPIQYDIVEYVCYSLKEVNEQVINLKDFRVYTIGKYEYKTKDEILNNLKWVKEKELELKEFEQYQKLKEKFEK